MPPRLDGKDIERKREHRDVLDVEHDRLRDHLVPEQDFHLAASEVVVRSVQIARGVAPVLHEEDVVGDLSDLLPVVEPFLVRRLARVDRAAPNRQVVGHGVTRDAVPAVQEHRASFRTHPLGLRVEVDALRVQAQLLVRHVGRADDVHLVPVDVVDDSLAAVSNPLLLLRTARVPFRHHEIGALTPAHHRGPPRPAVGEFHDDAVAARDIPPALRAVLARGPVRALGVPHDDRPPGLLVRKKEGHGVPDRVAPLAAPALALRFVVHDGVRAHLDRLDAVPVHSDVEGVSLNLPLLVPRARVPDQKRSVLGLVELPAIPFRPKLVALHLDVSDREHRPLCVVELHGEAADLGGRPSRFLDGKNRVLVRPRVVCPPVISDLPGVHRRALRAIDGHDVSLGEDHVLRPVVIDLAGGQGSCGILHARAAHDHRPVLVAVEPRLLPRDPRGALLDPDVSAEDGDARLPVIRRLVPPHRGLAVDDLHVSHQKDDLTLAEDPGRVARGRGAAVFHRDVNRGVDILVRGRGAREPVRPHVIGLIGAPTRGRRGAGDGPGHSRRGGLAGSASGSNGRRQGECQERDAGAGGPAVKAHRERGPRGEAAPRPEERTSPLRRPHPRFPSPTPGPGPARPESTGSPRR